MISQKLEQAINEQIKWELFSSYLYLSMASYFDSINLKGSSSWMKVQAQEELTHAMRFYNYVVSRGGRVKTLPIDGPDTEWDSPLAAFSYGYEHETVVSKRINDLVDLSMSESDHATTNFLQWFVAEQVEEEENFDGVVQRLKMVGDAGNGLFMLDSELGARVFTMPADMQA